LRICFSDLVLLLKLRLIKPVSMCASHKDTEVTWGHHLILLFHWPAVTLAPVSYCAPKLIRLRGYMSPRRQSGYSKYQKYRSVCLEILPVFVSYTSFSSSPSLWHTFCLSFQVSRLALCLYCTWGPGGRRTSLQSRPCCHPHVVCWIIIAGTWADSDIHKSWAQMKKDKCKPEHAPDRNTGAGLLHVLTPAH